MGGMKTALHSWSFRERFKADKSFNIFQALDETARMGFTGIEIMTGKANCPVEDIGGEDIGHLRKVKKYAEKLGIEILSFATYNDFAYVKDETWRLANIEYIKRWLPLTGEAGVPNIRMLTGYHIEGEDRRRLEDLTREGIRQCIPIFNRCDLFVGVGSGISHAVGSWTASPVRRIDCANGTALSTSYTSIGPCSNAVRREEFMPLLVNELNVIHRR